MKNIKFLVFLLFIPFVVQTLHGQVKRSDCEQLEHQLGNLAKRTGNENPALTYLFKVGDTCIDEIVSFVGGKEFELSVAAQEVIRYLGNETAVKAVNRWNLQNKRPYPVWGPVPVAIMEFDYEMIDANLVDAQRLSLSLLTSKYVFALAIDKTTQRSAKLLANICSRIGPEPSESRMRNVVTRLCSEKPLEPFNEGASLEKAVLDNAFFVDKNDLKHTRSNLIAFNSDRSKALFEVIVSRGLLAEEWYHVVVKRTGGNWTFYSVTFIKQS